MKRIVGGAFSSVNSSTIACNRSSNSPLYLVPATRLANSRETTRWFLNLGGQSLANSPNLETCRCFTKSPSSLRSKSSSTLSSIPGAARICATPSTIAVLPTPGSPIKQGLFFLRRTKVLNAFKISSSLPCTGSNSNLVAKSVKSTPISFRVGVEDIPPSFPVTNCGPSPVASLGYLRSITNLRQNSAAENVELSTPSIRKNTANAPLAYPLSSTVASTSGGTFPWAASYPKRAKRTCSEFTVGDSNESAIKPAFDNTLFNGGANGNSTSLAFLFMFKSCGLMVKIFPFFPPSPFSPFFSSSSLRNIFPTVNLALRKEIP
mmetsp:Transcript_17585/g.35124  ORF Transcript_17585/g.35124 Transcript_17585/m.35124 type:complete len:320 (-) Transcript_17585:466-1425(-)